MATLPAYAHWESTGAFKIAIAGTSHYRTEIQGVAKNPRGTHTLSICLAYLVLDDQNQHDPNAVRVVIKGKAVGYLPASYAAIYRTYVGELPPHIKHVSAAAAITGGLSTNERDYEYTIELDIPDSLKLHALSEALDNEVVRINGYAPLQLASDGSYFVKVWLPTPDLSELHKNQRVQEWTTDAWETVNYYAINRQGIGLGFKLYEITKAQHMKLFKNRNTSAILEVGNGRFATLRIRGA